MTEPQTKAGRAMLRQRGHPDWFTVGSILAIEAEARADALAGITDEYKEATDAAMNFGDGYKHGRADALREAAERVRALPGWFSESAGRPFDGVIVRDAVLALLQAEPTPRED